MLFYSQFFSEFMPFLRKDFKKISYKKEECCGISWSSLGAIFFMSFIGIAVVIYFFFLPLLKDLAFVEPKDGEILQREEALQNNENGKNTSNAVQKKDPDKNISAIQANIFGEQFFLKGNRNGDKVLLRWTEYANDDFLSYQVVRSDTLDEEGTVIFSTKKSTDKEFTDISPRDEGMRYYRVTISTQKEGEKKVTNAVQI